MSSLLRILASLLILATMVACTSAPPKPTAFVFVKITEAVEPLERARKYEDPLGVALRRVSLGDVTGGGSLLSREKKIEWVGVDVELTDLDAGIPFLRSKLVELGAPRGSTLEYNRGGKKIQLPVHP